MRQILMIFLMMMFTMPAFAGARISPDQVKQFTTSCLKNGEQDQTMSPQTKQIFCSCTGQFMQKNLTMTDLQNMSAKGQIGRNATNKMLTGVYAPCMEFPVRDMIQKQCMTDVKQASVCSCLSKHMAAYTAKSAQTTLKQVLAKTPNAFDPMGAIIDSPEFQAQQKQITMQCLTGKLK